MRVLVACEFSGIVRDAFRALGHDAWSCDLMPSERPGQHICGNVESLLHDPPHSYYLPGGYRFDLMIAHPPCTYLCNMGIWWNAKRPERWPLTFSAKSFVDLLWKSPIPRIAIENPIGFLNKNWRKPSQIVHPWQFGDEASKPTCLWLKNLPKLTPTKIVGKGEFYTKANGHRMAKWSHITSGTRKDERAKIASRTFPGIAQAMAQQWGGIAQECAA